MWFAGFVLSILAEIRRVSFRFPQFLFYLTKLKSKQNSYNHVNIYSTKKADLILEMPGLGEFCANYFKNHYVKVDLRLNITYEFQDRLAIYHVSISADDENLLYSKRSTKKVLPKSKIIKKKFLQLFSVLH